MNAYTVDPKVAVWLNYHLADDTPQLVKIEELLEDPFRVEFTEPRNENQHQSR